MSGSSCKPLLLPERARMVAQHAAEAIENFRLRGEGLRASGA